MTEETVTLELLAAQQVKLLDEMREMRADMRAIRVDVASFRDDMRVITALALRQDNTMARLLDRVRALEEQT